ncbi:MAG: twitching motility protein PilT [Verrucomicrobiota bacterium]|jgi:twitching motility protein PilT
MDKPTIDALLTAMLQTSDGVSDLLFVCGRPPLVEVHGHLTEFPIDTPSGLLDEAAIEAMAQHLIDGKERLTRDFAEMGACDCSYAIENVARFRVNIFRQCGRYGIVMRKLPTEIPTLDSLGLPPVFREMLKEKNGIIFVTGGTGSGKTTTLAAMLNELNATQQIHIVTLEDPIEFRHPHRRAVMSQRELGNDFPTFASGLRAAMRQAPKVILVGEIRDRESLEIAMSASETGHVVFTTLHTINAGQTINRILGMFSREEEQQLRQRLAETIRYVVSQRLVSKIAGGRLLVTEVMGSSLRTRETIAYGESENKTFHEIIESGTTLGWHSFDQKLLAAFEAGQITEETTILYCASKARMRQQLDQVKKRNGATAVDGPSGLKLNMPVPVESILEQVEKGGSRMGVASNLQASPPPIPARSS